MMRGRLDAALGGPLRGSGGSIRYPNFTIVDDESGQTISTNGQPNRAFFQPYQSCK